MIAHIRKSKQRDTTSPIIRARHMVAETLLTSEPATRRPRGLRKILAFCILAILSAVAALGFYLYR